MLRKSCFPILVTALLLGLVACSPTQNGTAGNRDDATAADNDAIEALPGVGITVRAGNSDWIQEQFTTEIINIGLEKLGYEVEAIQQADYAALAVAIANGDLDYHSGYYDPTHNKFFASAGGEQKLERIGDLLPGGGRNGLMIDKKVADQYGITNLDQLKDPELAKLFDTDGDGKANLAGCQAGWACAERIDHHIEVYNLQETVEHDKGAYAALIADVLVRQERGEPVLYYVYDPHWLLTTLKPDEDAIWLEVPFTSLPGGLGDAESTMLDGRNLGHPVTVLRVLANQKFVDENPVASRWFGLVQVPVEDVRMESLRISEGEDSAADIRRHAEKWVEQNQDLFNGWLEAAKQPAS